MICSLASKNWRPLSFKCWHFEASEDIISKFRSQGLYYIIRIKYWNVSGNGSPPSLIPILWNISILYYKQAKLRKHLQQSLPILIPNFRRGCQRNCFYHRYWCCRRNFCLRLKIKCENCYSQSEERGHGWWRRIWCVWRWRLDFS